MILNYNNNNNNSYHCNNNNSFNNNNNSNNNNSSNNNISNNNKGLIMMKLIALIRKVIILHLLMRILIKIIWLWEVWLLQLCLRLIIVQLSMKLLIIYWLKNHKMIERILMIIMLLNIQAKDMNNKICKLNWNYKVFSISIKK